MTVYVDNAAIPYGRMKMCHMVADSTRELLAMADAIGVARRWLQHPDSPKVHFDICQAKRVLALRAGAVAITQRELGLRLLAQREAR